MPHPPRLGQPLPWPSTSSSAVSTGCTGFRAPASAPQATPHWPRPRQFPRHLRCRRRDLAWLAAAATCDSAGCAQHAATSPPHPSATMANRGKPRRWSEADAEAASREHAGMATGCLAPAPCHMNRAMHCMHLSTRAIERRLQSRVVPSEGADCRSWRRR
ncbi:hypothetical protein OsI_35732 [Oryza sativa Indica Group]|uniref:Uncharacterized protein n=1 Tax=Oryza sativa subsp. indica TaxID=39946 RepID=A2ZD67_ORYSI|nr:hypothetical protein OsI_35732 [Oryza sativa Indica Group]